VICSDDIALNQTCRQLRYETAAPLTRYEILRLHDGDWYMDSQLQERVTGTRLETLIMPLSLFHAVPQQLFRCTATGWDCGSVVRQTFPEVEKVIVEGTWPSHWDMFDVAPRQDWFRYVFGKKDLVVVDEKGQSTSPY